MSLQAHEKFGDQVPYGDPSWYQGAPTPYYTASHVAFRAKMRAFVEKELKPYVDEWDEAGDYPEELREKAYKAGILGAIWPAEHGGTPPPDFDAFHDFIWMDELCRCGGGGILWAVFTGFGIALPPVLKHGTPEMRAKVARPVISGQKVMSLAISEPWVGSDVAGLQTTAVKSPDGKHYIVNGAKKWITGGMKASFFTVAVRTGGEGVNGISLILMEAGAKGFETRRMKTQGWWTSGTAYLDFDDVYVPVENLIGIENKGFQYIMHNFNHERWALATMANRFARECLEESITYARTRKTFGQRLIDHQVIRHKIAEMASRVEGCQLQLENIAFQMKAGAPQASLGGPCALVKVASTRTLEFCAREASQIFGGASYVREGKGQKVERIYREVRVNAIGGGSEEVLIDLAMKQARL